MRRPPPLPALPPPSAPPAAQRAGPQPGGKRGRPADGQRSRRSAPRGPGARGPTCRPAAPQEFARPTAAPSPPREGLRTVAHRGEGSAVPQPRQPLILPLPPKANEAFTRREQLLLWKKLESPLHPVVQGLFTHCTSHPSSPIFGQGGREAGHFRTQHSCLRAAPGGLLRYPQATCQRGTKKVKLI